MSHHSFEMVRLESHGSREPTDPQVPFFVVVVLSTRTSAYQLHSFPAESIKCNEFQCQFTAQWRHLLSLHGDLDGSRPARPTVKSVKVKSDYIPTENHPKKSCGWVTNVCGLFLYPNLMDSSYKKIRDEKQFSKSRTKESVIDTFWPPCCQKQKYGEFTFVGLIEF